MFITGSYRIIFYIWLDIGEIVWRQSIWLLKLGRVTGPRFLCKTSVSNLWNNTWWYHQMETFSAFLAICAGNSPVTGEFPAHRPLMRSFDVFFDLRLNKRLSKQSWCWWIGGGGGGGVGGIAPNNDVTVMEQQFFIECIKLLMTSVDIWFHVWD